MSSRSNSSLMASLCMTSPCNKSTFPSINEKVSGDDGWLALVRFLFGMVDWMELLRMAPRDRGRGVGGCRAVDRLADTNKKTSGTCETARDFIQGTASIKPLLHHHISMVPYNTELYGWTCLTLLDDGQQNYLLRQKFLIETLSVFQMN